MAAAGCCKTESWGSIPEETEWVGILKISELKQWIQALQWQCQADNAVVHLALIPDAYCTLQQIAEGHRR